MFDLNFLCIKQQKPVEFKEYNFWVGATNVDYMDSEKKYFEIWRYFNLTDGICYEVMENENVFGGTNIGEIINECQIVVPYWLKEREDIIEDFYAFRFKTEYYQDLKKFMQNLIELSPVKMILVLLRCQSSDRETVCGSLSLEEFFELMNAGKIYSNICYIVSGNKLEN